MNELLEKYKNKLVQGNRIDPVTKEYVTYLPLDSKISWFRDMFPEGLLEVKEINHTVNNSATFVAAVYKNCLDEKPLAVAYATRWRDEQNPGAYYSCAESAALGKALSWAGFGCQLEEEVADNVPNIPLPDISGEVEKSVEIAEETKKVTEAVREEMTVDEAMLMVWPHGPSKGQTLQEIALNGNFKKHYEWYKKLEPSRQDKKLLSALEVLFDSAIDQ